MKLSNVTGDEVKVLLFIVGIIVIGIVAYYRSTPHPPAPFIPDSEVDSVREKDKPPVTVDVSGAVWRPGVYTLPGGSRVGEALEKAMLRPDADIDRVNRAQVLTDGQKIVIPAAGEMIEGGGALPGMPDRININTATAEELMSLPGIGRVRAEEIVIYRGKKGKFSSIDDLAKIPGIGEATVERLRGRVVAE